MTAEEYIKVDFAMTPWKRAIVSILYTGYSISDRLNETLKPFGISEQQLNVLHILRRQNTHNTSSACNLCDVQEQMMHKMSNATRLVEKLRLKGLVTREIDEANRRKVEITITEKGLKFLEKVEETLKVQHDHLYATKLSEQEFNQLSELLDKFRH
jgi:DNA-binding MarR family transcriptional regulator